MINLSEYFEKKREVTAKIKVRFCFIHKIVQKSLHFDSVILFYGNVFKFLITKTFSQPNKKI